ncbi:hypothetical protein [Archaeoglobus sp.]
MWKSHKEYIDDINVLEQIAEKAKPYLADPRKCKVDKKEKCLYFGISFKGGFLLGFGKDRSGEIASLYVIAFLESLVQIEEALGIKLKFKKYSRCCQG